MNRTDKIIQNYIKENPYVDKTLQAWLSITLMAASATLPQYISSMPDDWKPIATAGIALIAAAWHRYQPSPSGKTQ